MDDSVWTETRFIGLALWMNVTARRAKLDHTRWQVSDVSSSDFTGADFTGADLGAFFANGCDFTGADFSGADLSELVANDSIFHDVRISPDTICPGGLPAGESDPTCGLQ